MDRIRPDIVFAFAWLACAAAPARADPAAAPPDKPAPAREPAGRVEVDLGAATRVTLHLKDEPAASALRQLAEASGAEHRPQLIGEGFAPVSLDVEDLPYLEAYCKLCAALRAQPSGRDVWQNAMLYANDPNADPGDDEVSWVSGPAAAHGPFRVVAREARRYTLEQFDRNAPPQQLRPPAPTVSLSLSLLVEPRVTVTAFVLQLDVKEAVDEQGRSLVAADHPPFAQLWSDAQPVRYFELGTVLTPPPEAGRRLARLSGVAHVRAVSAFQEVEVGELDGAAPIEREVGGMRCFVMPAAPFGGAHVIIVTAARPADEAADDWDRRKALIRLGSRFRAYDKDGAALQHHWAETEVADNAVKFTVFSQPATDDRGQPLGGPPRPAGVGRAGGDARHRDPRRVQGPAAALSAAT